MNLDKATLLTTRLQEIEQFYSTNRPQVRFTWDADVERTFGWGRKGKSWGFLYNDTRLNEMSLDVKIALAASLRDFPSYYQAALDNLNARLDAAIADLDSLTNKGLA